MADFDALPLDLQDILSLKPKVLIQCLEYAAHQIMYKETVGCRIHVRIHNLPKCTRYSKLMASSVGKFCAIQGTVVRVSSVRPMVSAMEYKCPKCEGSQVVQLKDGAYRPPDKCMAKRCGGGRMEPWRRMASTFDWQKLKVEELKDGNEQGRIPRTIEVELKHDLCDCVLPGDMVTVCGIIKAGTGTERRRGGGTPNNAYILYMDASSCSKIGSMKNKPRVSGPADQALAGLGLEQWTEEDYQLFQNISTVPNPFKLIVNSLCPAIFGHEIVKAGLALVLFGGSQRDFGDQASPRPDSHMLIVGDPGLGKSQMLRAASHISPRGVYVCGNTTSSSGLTVTVVRDQATGDYALEAGALVLGDRGVCCIDEFDKMGVDHHSLLEAMEQQRISVAKAGIVCNLPARTSVLAAANPIGGHYTRGRTVAENLKLHPALLSRFDLIYILLDTADQEKDRLLSRHVMKLHSRMPAPTHHSTQHTLPPSEAARALTSGALSQKLKLQPHEAKMFQEIPPQCLRKYITYAKQTCNPPLNAEAAHVLQEFYLGLRSTYQNSDCTPITTRQLESLIRLSQARAKLALRSEVTREDAEDVIGLMKESLYDVLRDEAGAVDFTRLTGMSAKAQQTAFLKELARQVEKGHPALWSLQELRGLIGLMRVKIKGTADEFIHRLNEGGLLLKKGNNMYALLGGGF
uniref:DNA helicase n=1 Tax=Eutreptiella gymnastica TaxID=73025 RepID=A0A7S1NNR3_9EUGL